MARLLRMVWLLALILLVPVIPFLAFGSSLEEWLARWEATEKSGAITAAVVVGVLATDIFLPVPSSVISTLGGVRLGWAGGTLASWLGMMAGSCLGFWIARRWGRPVAQRFAQTDDLEQICAAQDRFGPFLLVLLRGVPVLAEASVLLAGASDMAWRRFLPPVVLSNLGIALAYSAFGDIAGRHQWLPMAFAVAIALPVLLAAAAQRLLKIG